MKSNLFRECAIIAKHLPGVGCPWDLPVDEWYGLLAAAAELNADENTPSTHRGKVDAQMRRLYG